MASNSVKINVGRLLEIRVDAGFRTEGDVDDLFDAITAEVRRAGVTKAIGAVDWRNCPFMAPAAAARLTERMMASNTRTERSAALARPDSQMLVLQFLRVIREAKMTDRKLFLDPLPLLQWLDEVLTPDESLRLRAFLGV